MTYPDGREVNYDYGTTGAIDDIMSRLASIKDDDGSTVLASYKYLGAGRIVTEDYEEIEVKLDYNANDNLGGLDRFGRVADQVWNDYGATPDVVLDRYTYTYDRVGNRTSRDNELHAAFDEDYTYDALYRLTDTARADAFDQSWDLDGLGNWGTFDDDGTSQTREVNKANEITGIDGSSDDVAHDAAGNMIRVPKLDGSGNHFHLVYDAWNHLVKVYDSGGTTLIAQYQYDGTGRRIVKGVDENSDGSLDTFTHFFHNRDNQVLETRQGDDVSGAAPAAESLEPKHQFIWSPRYVDSLILRDDHDAQGGLIPANRLYYLADANYNVTALFDAATGTVVERYLYTPYGTVTVLNPDFSVDADGKSDYDNTTLYTGREFDPETELMYYRARYYHSELGRFVGRDPIGYYAGLSLLNYVGNRPVQMVDPAGLVPNWRYDYWGPTDTTAAVRPPSWERLPPITIEEPSPIYLPPPERLPPVNIGPPPQQPFPPITVPPQFPGVGQLETPSLNLYPPGKCLSPFESLIQDLIHNYWPRYTDPPEESGESQASLPLLDPGDPGHPNLPGGGGLITFPVLGGQGSIGIDVQPGQRNPLPGHIQIEWPIRRK